MDDEQVPGIIRLRLEVESVQVLQLGEGKYSCKCQEQVESQDHHIVEAQQTVDVLLVGYGGNCNVTTVMLILILVVFLQHNTF